MKVLYIFFIVVLSISNAQAQSVGIGTTTPVVSAQLDVSSNTKGFLPPRMTNVQRDAIQSPVAGLVVWCSNCGYNGELNVYNGTAWTNMLGNPATPPQVPPTVITTAISAITTTSAVSGGNVTADGYSAVTARGVCWDIATNPTVALPTKTNNGTGTGSFVSNITGLTPGTIYYVRAYATNAIGTSYGAEFSFTTGPFAPTIITTAISGITATSAVSGGNVTSDGFSAVTVRGVCWDIATSPTVALSTKTNDGTGTGIFVSNITGLTSGTTYYVRAYATNAVGTSYGNEFSFTPALTIGNVYQGGIIAYVLQPGDPGYIAGQTHGLIAAASNQSTSAVWGCSGIQIGAFGTALGTGNQNTINIMAGCGTAGIAARICGDLVLNGFSDWFLPSQDELNKLYINRVAIGGFSSNFYWSSSEVDDRYAWSRNFSNGGQYIDYKPFTYYVRAVRAF
jgi:hypothetical protein